MTQLKISQDQRLALVVTDSRLVEQWIKKSPSRVWWNYAWHYPVSELQDIITFLHTLNEQYTVDPVILAAYQEFNVKIELVRRIKEKAVTEFNISTPAMFKGELYQHQYEALAQMLLMHRCLLALQVGMGKTVIALFALLKLRESLQGKMRALIICEAGQIHKPWMETIFKFTDIKDVLIIQGDANERARQIAAGKANPTKHWLWLCGYDTIRIDQTPVPELDLAGNFKKDDRGNIITNTPNLFPMDGWDVICIDEITKIKNVSTKGSKVLRELEAPYIFGLSGTPITNSYFDLYGIMKMINPFIFTNKQNFTDRYLKLDYFGNPKGLLPGAEVELNKKIFPWVRQILKKDVGKDKPITVHTIPIALTPLQQKELDEVMRQINDGEKTAFESGTTLRQICNTLKIVTESEPVLDGQGNPIYDNKGEIKFKRVLKYPLIPLHESTNKVDELKRLVYDIVDNQGKKVVIFSFFKEALSIIKNELGLKYRVDVITGDTTKGCKFSQIEHCDKCSRYRLCSSTKRIIFDFNFKDIKVLLGSDSLSKAQNLHTCDTLINFDLPWSSADLEQRIGRVDRDSNPAKVFYMYNLATLGTIEEKIIKIIETKEYESSKVFPKYNVSLSKLSKTIRVVKGADEVSGGNGGV